MDSRYGPNEPQQVDPTADHWLEPGAPAAVASAIARHAVEVQKRLGAVGTGGPDCLTTRDAWADVFEDESIDYWKLGHTVDKYRVRISLISPLWFAGIRHPVSRVFAAFSEAAPAADAGRQFIP